MNVFVLPHHQLILFQIVDVIERRWRREFEQEPPDVRMEKPLVDVVRVLVVIDMFMMRAVFARPEQHGVFECSRTEEHSEEADRPVRLKSQVRKETVIAEGYAEAARCKHHEEQNDLKSIDPKVPDIEWHCRERKQESADEKRAGDPVNFFERNTTEHFLERR